MIQNQLIRFHLNLSYDQYLLVYRGLVKSVSVKAEDGRNIQFPVGHIQQFLTNAGVQGYFEMELSPQNKFIAIKKII